MNSSDLKTLQDTNLATNDAHEITAAKLREVTTELIKKSGGWADYNNSSTILQEIVGGGSWTQLTNDGAGAYTNTNYKPYYLTSLWSDNAVDLTDIPEGTLMTLRFDITLSILSNNTDVKFRVKFKNSEGTEVYTHLFDFRAFKSTGSLSGVNLYEFYVGSDILNGSAELEISCDKDIEATLNGILISIP
jgi:hypothetical protein